MINQTRPFIDSLESLFIAAPIELETDMANLDTNNEPLSFNAIFSANLEDEARQKDAALDEILPITGTPIKMTNHADEFNSVKNRTNLSEEVTEQDIKAEVEIKTDKVLEVKKSEIKENTVENKTVLPELKGENKKEKSSVSVNEESEKSLQYAVMMMMLQHTPLEEKVSSSSVNPSSNEMSDQGAVSLAATEANLPQYEADSILAEIQEKFPESNKIELNQVENEIVTASNNLIRSENNEIKKEIMPAVSEEITTKKQSPREPTTNRVVNPEMSAKVGNEIQATQSTVKIKRTEPESIDFAALSVSSKNSAPEAATVITPVVVTTMAVTSKMETDSVLPFLEAANETVISSRIESELSSEKWGVEVADKINIMLSQKQHSVNLLLNPPELGQVRVKVNFQEEGATLFFDSPHQEVRAAIENAMPQLTEMMKESGVSLAQVNVGLDFSQSYSSADNKHDNSDQPHQSDNKLHADVVEDVRVNRKNLSDGLVDVFV